MWLLFTAPFRWRVPGGSVIRYDTGMQLRVTRACAAAALAAGVAEKVANPTAQAGHGAHSDD